MSSSDRTKIVTLVVGSIILFFMVGLYAVQTLPSKAEAASAQFHESVLGIFEGITPCSGENPPIPHIPPNTDCEMMTWKLTLHQDPATGNPTTYELSGAYGLAQQGTTGLQNGGTPLNLGGKWAELLGTAENPDAIIYQLNADTPEAFISFVRLDNNLLHLLTPDKRLTVGSAAWSYTLNRTDQPVVSDPVVAPDDLQPITGEVATPGVFEGRIPCVEAVRALHHISASGCQRVKMQLTLNTDSVTPSTFELFSVYVGAGNTRYHAAGTWVALQGTAVDPAVVIYQLTPDVSQTPISFLKADDNHLFLLDADFKLIVGDALMSFTLSRAEE